LFSPYKNIITSSAMISDARAENGRDVYGQLHPLESRELVQDKLAEFDALLKEITEKEENETSKSLLQATEKCPNLLTSDFKLIFLRCELFNADAAVHRYVQYWTRRVTIFGPEKAFQPLTLDAALSEDRVALEIGFVRLVPGVTDPQGRAIVYVNPSVQDRTKYTRYSMCRAIWYVLHAALESETAQKHGVILLGDPSGSRLSQFDRQLAKAAIPCIQGAIPLRVSAFHLCHPPTFISIILPIFKFFLSDRMKKRVQVHIGSTEIVLKNLNERYGIDESIIPEALGGTVKVDHLGWLRQRRAQGL
jgi:hypothetical protein